MGETKRLEGKTALVTGGSQGIGQGIAPRLAREGADVIVTYHTHPEGAAETLREIEAAGRRGAALPVNVAEMDSIRALMRQARERFGSIDVLVNNAGIEKRAPFWEVSEADYDAVLTVKLQPTPVAADGCTATAEAVVNATLTELTIDLNDTSFPLPAYCNGTGTAVGTVKGGLFAVDVINSATSAGAHDLAIGTVKLAK